MNIKNRIVKYLSSFLVFFIFITLSGEEYYSYFVSDIDNKTFIRLDISDNNNFETIIKGISSKYDIDIYIINNDYTHGNLKLQKKIACLSEDISGLKKHLNVDDGVYKSILYGKTTVTFSDLIFELRIGPETCFNLIGTESEIDAFCNDLNSKIPVTGFYPECVNDSLLIIKYICWIIAAIFVFILTLYDVNCNKKEAFIRISFGERKSLIFFYNVISDIVIYCLEFIVLYNIAGLNTCVKQCLNSLILFMITITAITIIPYLSLLKFDPKKLKAGKYSKTMLRFNIGFIFITSILSISGVLLLLSTNNDFIKYKKINDYIECYGSFSLCDIQFAKNGSYDTTEQIIKIRTDDMLLNENIYRKYYKELDPVIFIKSNENVGQHYFIYANANSFEYIHKVLPEIDINSIDKDVCIFVPESLSDEEIQKCLELGKETVEYSEGKNFCYSSKIITYKKNAEFVTLNDPFTYDWEFIELQKNPVIVLNTIAADTMTTSIKDANRLYYEYLILYNINQNQVDKITKEYNLEKQIFFVTNLEETYDYFYSLLNRIVTLLKVISLSIILITIIVNISVIKINYDLNAVELALKKVMGYSCFEKNILSVIWIISSCILSGIINMLIFKNNMAIILCLSLMAAMLIFVAVQISFSEKSNVNTVIKSRK